MNVTALRELAESLPPGTAVPVPREWLLHLLNGNGHAEAPAEKMLTAVEVKALLGTTERWVYNHAIQLGGKRLSARCLRFPETAVQRYVDRRR